MEKQSQQNILKDKDKRALTLFKFSKVQKIKHKTNRCIAICSSLLESVVSDDADENKTDISVAKIICSVIEFLFKNSKKYKANKLEIALVVFESLFGTISEGQKKLIIKNVNHIVDNDEIQVITNLDLIKKDLVGLLKWLI